MAAAKLRSCRVIESDNSVCGLHSRSKVAELYMFVVNLNDASKISHNFTLIQFLQVCFAIHTHLHVDLAL